MCRISRVFDILIVKTHQVQRGKRETSAEVNTGGWERESMQDERIYRKSIILKVPHSTYSPGFPELCVSVRTL